MSESTVIDTIEYETTFLTERMQLYSVLTSAVMCMSRVAATGAIACQNTRKFEAEIKTHSL